MFLFFSFVDCRTTGGEQAAKSLPACRSGYLVCRDVQGTSLFLFAAFNFLIEISQHSLHFLTGHFFRFRRVCVHGASVLEIIWDYPLFPEASEILRNSFRIFSSSRLALRARGGFVSGVVLSLSVSEQSLAPLPDVLQHHFHRHCGLAVVCIHEVVFWQFTRWQVLRFLYNRRPKNVFRGR